MCADRISSSSNISSIYQPNLSSARLDNSDIPNTKESTLLSSNQNLLALNNVSNSGAPVNSCSFSNSNTFISGDRLNMRVIDYNGIGNNAPNDLEVDLNGTVGISRRAIDTSVAQLNQELSNATNGLVKATAQFNSSTKQYDISIKLHTGLRDIDAGKINIATTNDGIGVKAELSLASKAAYYAAFGPAGLINNPDHILQNFTNNTLKNNMGMSTEQRGDWTILKPNFVNSGYLKILPVGNMTLNLQSVQNTGSSFNFDQSGNLSMNLSLKAYGGTDLNAPAAKYRKEIPDIIQGQVSFEYGAEKSRFSVQNGSVNLNIQPQESQNVQQQLKGFGIQNSATVSGQVQFNQISTSAEYKNNQWSLDAKGSGAFSAKDLRINHGDIAIGLNSTGSLKYLQHPNGGFGIDLSGTVSGGFQGYGTTLAVDNLNIAGKVEYNTPINKNDSANYEIIGQVKAKSIQAKVGEQSYVDIENPSFHGTATINARSGDLKINAPEVGLSASRAFVAEKGVILVNLADINVKLGQLEFGNKGGVSANVQSMKAKGNIGLAYIDLTNSNVKANIRYDVKESSLKITGEGKSNATVTNFNASMDNAVVKGLNVSAGGINWTNGAERKVEIYDGSISAEQIAGKFNNNIVSLDKPQISGIKKAVIDLGRNSLDIEANAQASIKTASFNGLNFTDVSFSAHLYADKNAIIIDNGNVDLTSVRGNVNGHNIDLHNLKVNARVEVSLKDNFVNIGDIKGNTQVKLQNMTFDTNNLHNLNFSGKMSVNPNGELVIESEKLAFEGKLGNNTLKLHGNGFAGKISYRPDSGIVIEGIKGKDTKLSGTINGKDFEMSANGTVVLDKNGGFVEAKNTTLSLNTQDLKIEGNGVSVRQEGNNFIANADNTNVNISKKDQKVAQNLKMSGQIVYDKTSTAVTFNNPAAPFKIQSGSLLGADFFNFETKGQIQLANNYKTVVLRGDSGFTGTVKYNGIGLSNFKSEKDIIFDSSSGTPEVNISGNTDFALKLTNDTERKIQVSGNAKMQAQGDKFVINSNDVSLTAKFAQLNLEGLKMKGKLTFDTKTQELTLEKLDDSTPIELSGKINGKDINLSSKSGSLNFKLVDANTVITAKDVSLSGTVDGIDVNTTTNVNGQVILSSSAKPQIIGLKGAVDLNGVKVDIGQVDAKEGANGSYELNLSGGNIEAGKGKIKELITKTMAKIPAPLRQEAQKNLDQINNFLNDLDINKFKIDEFKISLDKNLNYKINITTSDSNFELPSKGIKFNNNGGKLQIEADKNNVDISADKTKINASIGDTQIKDLELKGKIRYSKDNSGREQIQFVKSNKVGLDSIEANGLISRTGLGNPIKISLKANADVSLERRKGEIEFSGKNLSIDSMFDDLNVKSVPISSDGKNPTYASGKVIIKDDGKIDVSGLKFSVSVGGAIVSSNNTNFTSSDQGYKLTVSASANAEIKSISSLLSRISNSTMTPAAIKDGLETTIKNAKLAQSGNINTNQDLVLNLDKNMNVSSLNGNSDIKLENVVVNAKINNKDVLLTIDQANISNSYGTSSDGKKFITNGSLKMNLSDSIKKQVSQAVKDQILSMVNPEKQKELGVKLKNIDIEIANDGKVYLKGKVGYNIFRDINLGVSISIEGKEAVVSVDKIRLGGFLGFLQGAILGNRVEKEVTNKVFDEAIKAQPDLKITHDKKEPVVRIDIQSVISKYVGDKFELKNASLKDNQLSIDYSVKYGN